MVIPIDCKTVPLDAGFKGLIHRLQKIIAMRLDMEADQIGAQQSVQEFPLPGADPEGFRVGPGNMPEDCDPRVGPLRFYEPGQQREMIILNQNERLLRIFDFLQHGLREFLIYTLVMFPVPGPKHGPCMSDMTERPNSLVREPQIVSFFLFLGEPQAAERVVRMIGGNAQPVICVDGFPIRIRGAMGDPGAITSIQDGLQGRYQAARGHACLDSVASMYVLVRLAVGYHK